MSAKPTPTGAQKRRTLALYGRRGDAVRVLVDKKAERVEVKYRDADGAPRKRIFPDTADGRASATAWASTYHAARDAERKRAAEPKRPRTTHRALWDAYAASPAWDDLRPKSRINYAERWRTWERFRGRDALVDDTTLHHVDLFRAAMKRAGRASNSARQILNVARTIYNWGQTRKLVTTNEMALHKWKTKKGDEPLEPDEYSEAEFLALLAVLPPQSGRTWRANVAIMLAGHHGQRARAVLHLRWADVDLGAGELVWPPEFQKTGRELVQPLTDDGRAALLTALDWRRRTGYQGPWVLFAGGGNKRLGAAAGYGAGGTQRRRRGDGEDAPMTYGGLWTALRKAEERAGVAHRERRALHGFRKMNAGNVADRTGDDRLGMEWIGDVDMKQAKKYLRRRDARFDRAARAAGTDSRTETEGTSESVPEVSLTHETPGTSAERSL